MGVRCPEPKLKVPRAEVVYTRANSRTRKSSILDVSMSLRGACAGASEPERVPLCGLRHDTSRFVVESGERIRSGGSLRAPGGGGHQPACAEGSAFPRQGQERHLPVHAWRGQPRRYVRSQAGANAPQRAAAFGGAGQDN